MTKRGYTEYIGKPHDIMFTFVKRARLFFLLICFVFFLATTSGPIFTVVYFVSICKAALLVFHKESFTPPSSF